MVNTILTRPFKKTKIVATLGPASGDRAMLQALVNAGVDVFRLNFAHGQHAWLAERVKNIREISQETGIPIGILGDLSGPKIRLGVFPDPGIDCLQGAIFEFARTKEPDEITTLTSNYEMLIDDLNVGDPILLADGTVGMRVVEKNETEGRVKAIVERPGFIRSRQGINLPGVKLRTPSLTEKDLDDLKFALDQKIDFVGLSFVRSSDDIELLKHHISQHPSGHRPQIVAKIEKPEALLDLDAIIDASDCIMVARGDLGVEAEIVRVPILQKQIIQRCNELRVPVITATQMLDSMQHTPFPTRAEATDVANAVIDGSDAVMLSGETAVGLYPIKTVETMSSIVVHAEHLVQSRNLNEDTSLARTRAAEVTEAVTRAAGTAADSLKADLMVLCTQSGRTAMAISKQRGQIPILAVTDNIITAQKMTLYWGVIPLMSNIVKADPVPFRQEVEQWGRGNGLLRSRSKMVIVLSSKWSAETGHDLLMVHVLS
jgi:pyruvate kinase